MLKDFYLLVFPWVSPQVDGVRVKARRLPGLDEDEKHWTYFSSDKKKDWGKPLRWWTFGLWEPGGVYSGLYPWGCPSDKRRRDFSECISSRCLLKIVLQKTTVDFEKSQVLACLVSQEQEHFFLFLLFLAQFLAGGSQVYLVDSKTRLQALSNVLTVPSGSLTSTHM